MKPPYSYHIFYFPFKWHLPGEEKKLFSEQVDLGHIPVDAYSMWERKQITLNEKKIPSDDDALREAKELFGEQQYYFDFVHPVLYDIKDDVNTIISHYERREPKECNVEYCIKHGGTEYVLKIDSINLNIYSTGVGILSFFLANEREGQKGESAIRDINQYGRRIMPPHCNEFSEERRLLAEYISITGLYNDKDQRYSDSFDYGADGKSPFGLSDVWQPATFVNNLISDLSPSLKVIPVIDDRMFVNCWYGNNDLSKQISNNPEEFMQSDFWYKYVFVDSGDDDNDVTCQNDEMKKELLKASTYQRWQKLGTLFGVSRYSLVVVADEENFSKYVVSMHMRTIYSRMFELIIIQRASMLRFSGEVTKVSCLSGKDNKIVAERISSLYKEYIRFVNQIYFRSVTAQDQGIELYELMMKQLDSKKQIEDLDGEIGELHQYATLLIDQKRNANSEWLNLLAAWFLPATVITGLFGMNPFSPFCDWWHFGLQFSVIAIFSAIIYYIIKNRRN